MDAFGNKWSASIQQKIRAAITHFWADRMEMLRKRKQYNYWEQFVKEFPDFEPAAEQLDSDEDE